MNNNYLARLRQTVGLGSIVLSALTALAGMIVLRGSATVAEEGKKVEKVETAVLGGGCFWCVEAVYEKIEGVIDAESGYAGGKRKNPTYEEVSTGVSGHAEVVRVTFDPAKISFAEILEIFFHTHDPTTKNRQGHDVGTQYRSAIFYASDEQRKVAEEVIKKTDASGLWNSPIVTEVVQLDEFFRAEDYHQDYYANNPANRYCSLVIGPKIQKLYKEFANKLKKPAAKE